MSEEHKFVTLDYREYPVEEMKQRAEAFYKDMDRRRTVRDYTDREVPLEVIENAVRTAGTAPSGAHKQPWTFVLVRDPEIRQKVREAAEVEEKESYQHRMPQTWLDDLAPLGTDWHKPFLTTCPAFIVVFAQNYAVEEGAKKKHYYVQESVGIAVGMLIAALHNAGVATLTHTPSPMGFLGEILERPDNERAYMLLALGYPVSDCQVPDLERKGLEEILHVV